MKSDPRPNRPARRRVLFALLGGLCAAPIRWAVALMQRPARAFGAESVAATLAALYPDRELVESDQIRIAAADLAENGAVVPIKVTTDLARVRAISIIATKNPVPLVATFVCAPRTSGFVATRIKLAESCDVIAVVETEHGCFRAHKAIEVTIGGCGVA